MIAWPILRKYGLICGRSASAKRWGQLNAKLFVTGRRAALIPDPKPPIHYADEEPLEIAISAFGDRQDNEAKRVDLAAWRDQTSRSFRLRIFPGDLFFIHTARELFLQTVYQDLMLILNQLPGD
jgi:hypothetical protein